MKRAILFFMLAVFAIAMVSAQGNDRLRQRQGFTPRGPQYQLRDRDQQLRRFMPPQDNRNQMRRQITLPESTSVSGNLTIVQGMIAVKSDDITYLVRGLNRYVGFIDGLKDGAAVTLEGFARPNPQDDKVKFLSVQKLTLNGKDYDLARLQENVNPGKAMPGPGKIIPYPERLQPLPRQRERR